MVWQCFECLPPRLEEAMTAKKLTDYPRPSVATDVVLFTVADQPQEDYRKLPEKHLEVLLINRGLHPYQGSWALPGGFMMEGESLETAALRELQEETAASSLYLEQLYTFSEPGRDPRSWVISSAYMALIPKQSFVPKAGDDAADARWFKVGYSKSTKYGNEQGDFGFLELSAVESLENNKGRVTAAAALRATATVAFTNGEPQLLANSGLAFDHAKIIAYAIERLRGKLDYTPIAFNLLPQHFTLTQLQQIYEVILGKELLPPAFRRKIADKVKATDQYTKAAGHRPSRLYQRI